MGAMARDVLRRVRWGNVAIALGTLICLGAVVGWPRLSPPGPQLPADTARPVVTPAPGRAEPTGTRARRTRGKAADRSAPAERAAAQPAQRERAGGARGNRAAAADGRAGGGGSRNAG